MLSGKTLMDDQRAQQSIHITPLRRQDRARKGQSQWSQSSEIKRTLNYYPPRIILTPSRFVQTLNQNLLDLGRKNRLSP